MQGRPLTPRRCARRCWRLAAAATILGGLASVALTLVMTPELPPLLADWPLRAQVLTLLRTSGLPSLRSGLIALFFGLSVGLPTAAALMVICRSRAEPDPSEPTWQPGRLILLTTAAVLLCQLASPPRWSSDAFLFAYYGKIQAVHHANPYALPGRAFARTCALPQAPHLAATPGRPCRQDAHCPPPSRCLIDPFVPYQSWLEVRAAYGPVALGLFRMLYVEPLPPAANVLLLRLLMGLAFFALVVWVLRRRGPPAAALLGWLPLGAVVSANGGHLEALISLTLAALLMSAAASGPAAWIAIGVGVCAGLLAGLKLPLAALALPALMVLWQRRGVWVAALAAAIATAVVLGGYGLMWVDPHPFGGLMDVGDTSVRTPLDLIRQVSQSWGGRGDLSRWRVGFTAFWLLIVVVTLVRVRRKTLGLTTATLVIWLASTALMSGIYHPWYALPGLVLVSLEPAATSPLGPRRGALWLAVASPVVISALWLAVGPDAFALPWVGVAAVVLWGGVLGSLWLRPGPIQTGPTLHNCQTSRSTSGRSPQAKGKPDLSGLGARIAPPK